MDVHHVKSSSGDAANQRLSEPLIHGFDENRRLVPFLNDSLAQRSFGPNVPSECHHHLRSYLPKLHVVRLYGLARPSRKREITVLYVPWFPHC